MSYLKIFIFNGQNYITSKQVTLSEILKYFNYQNNVFIIEYNNLICNQNEWKNIKIYDNDKIEMITIVGGG